ncbi:L domain-like protein [Clavulina sp. PMI_390]|nr:L domain-like protein [Clavulina sp. PMI_390]
MTNQTILTEASFAITEDRLVQVITQVQPYEPHWEQLSEIHLAGFGIESVTNMKHYLPSLLSYLTGVPPLVRTLRVSHNQLTDLASYAHLRDLEYLDISYNRVESLTQLSCLPRLHELRAEGNSIRSLDGLQGMTYLTKLSLKKNRLPSVNLGDYDWRVLAPRLEILDLSSNSISGIKGLSGLKRLSMLNLGKSLISFRALLTPANSALNVSRPLSHLRILRLSDNRLPEFNAAPFVHLRTLYLDGNKLHHIHDLVRLVKLENLSLRNQAGGHLALNSRDIQDVKRLYLSGNPFTDLSFLTSACYNLIYLEVAGCRVSNLPPNLSSLIPNIRVLNLNYNFIADASPIQGLTRLKRLTLVGSRLKGTKTFLKVLRNMPDIEMIDVRMNPATLGWYLPLLVRDVPGALQPSESGTSYPLPAQDASDTRSQTATWEDLDSKFRRDLPNDSYLGRLAYRGLVMRACPKVAIIDGVKVTPAERDKAEQYLRGVLEARHQALTKAT